MDSRIDDNDGRDAPIDVGDKAFGYSFSTTVSDEQRSIADLVSTGPLVLVFFRAPWCASCAEQLATFDRQLDFLQQPYRNDPVDIVGVCRSSLSDLRRFQRGIGVRFDLASDPELAVSQDFTVFEEVGEHCVERPGYDVVSRPATYIIDEDGVVRYRKIAIDRPDERVYGNFVRNFIESTEKTGQYEDIYQSSYPHPYDE